jgi:hypothetical protein
VLAARLRTFSEAMEAKAHYYPKQKADRRIRKKGYKSVEMALATI